MSGNDSRRRRGGAVFASLLILLAVAAVGAAWLWPRGKPAAVAIPAVPEAPAAAIAPDAAPVVAPPAELARAEPAPAPPPPAPTPPPSVADATLPEKDVPALVVPPPPEPDTSPDKVVDKPSFDIVRIGPDGSAVVAGRAAPDAEVTVRDNGQVIAQAKADASGQFVVLPDKPLPSGGQELTLAAREPGKPEIAGDASVVLLVPAPRAAVATPTGAAAATPAAPVAVLTPANAPPRVLQAGPAPGGNSSGKVGLDVVDYDEHGAIRFAGTGAPGSRVRLYVDDAPVGDAIVDPQGRWGLAPGAGVGIGDHRLRLDNLGGHGQVTARVELPFQRAQLAPEDVQVGRVVVQPRQNLWRIARRAYGRGVRYTVIYEANRDQIRNPDRIYPGQVFAIPPLPGAPVAGAATDTVSTGTPASASTSK